MAVASCEYCRNPKGYYCEQNGANGRVKLYDYKKDKGRRVPIEKCRKRKAIYAQINRGEWPVVKV